MTLRKEDHSRRGAWFDFYRLACYGVILGVLVGFTGAYVPVGDSLAVFRPELSVLSGLAGLGAFLLGKRLIPALALVAVVLSGLSFAPLVHATPPDGATVTLRQHNVLYNNRALDQLVAATLRSNADIATFQEVGSSIAPMFEPLKERYTHFQHCIYGNGGVAVFARDLGPMVGHGCATTGKLAWIRLDTASGPVTFASVHLLWPWPMGQFWQSQELAKEIENLPQPVVMAGDFNMVPWASTTRMLADAVGGKIASGLEPTFRIGTTWPAFRIDNVIVPEGGRVAIESTPKFGSDHNGLFASIELPPYEKGGPEGPPDIVVSLRDQQE